MGESTLYEKIKAWLDNKILTYAYKSLKRDYNIDFGKYPTEELLTMYLKHKDEIKLD